MKNILLATDLSVNCDRALAKAVSLAKQHHCVLHVLTVMPEYYVPKTWDDNVEEKTFAEKVIKSSIDAHPDSEGLTIKITVLTGDTFSTILSFSTESESDLVVMGLHNKTKEEFRDLFVGTTIERIIRIGTKPVLLVRDKPTSHYDKVLVPTDFSVASQNAFDLAAQLEPKAVFHVLHIYDVPFAGFIRDGYAQAEVWQAAEDELDLFMNKALERFEAADKSLKVEKTLLRDAHYAGIMKIVKKEKPGLIAMGANGRGGIARAVLGSLAEDVLANPPCDVLVTKGL